MEKQVRRVHGVEQRGPSEQVHDKQIIFPPSNYEATTPFLMLSEDWFAAPRGFETHPHRGMQTVTFVLDGAIEHQRSHRRARRSASGRCAMDDRWARRAAQRTAARKRDGAHAAALAESAGSKLKMTLARYVNQHAAEVPVRHG